MTIYHKHHIVPKYMGGSDDPSNLVELTVEEHAEAHRKLYEEHGNWQDYLAWKGLSGRMDKEKIIRLKSSIVHKDKIVSEETRKRMSKAKSGKNNPMYGAISPNKGKFGEDSPRWGKTHSDETKLKLSRAAKNIKKIECPYCGKLVLPAHYGNYHKGEKCLKKRVGKI